jgi:hypothetical protein
MTAAATTPESGMDEPSSRGALSQLIQDANDRGLSYQKMSERAVDPESGTTLSKPYLQRLVANPPSELPQPQADQGPLQGSRCERASPQGRRRIAVAGI